MPIRARPKRRASRARQQEFVFRTWGGRRAGAGRKPVGPRAGVPHRARPEHLQRHPLHVTLRARSGLPTFRRQVLFRKVREAIAASSRDWFRILHFSVQSNHAHFMVEARDKKRLSSGVRGLAIRIALAVNRTLSRSGSVWADRYHARVLGTPREVRDAIVYVLANWKKHIRGAYGLDVCSSAWWFEGWKVPPAAALPDWLSPEPPVWAPREWLSTTGWRRCGLISRNERPAGSRR